MKKKITITGGIFLILFSLGYIFYFDIQDKPIQEIISENKTVLQKHKKNTNYETAAVKKKKTNQALKQVKKSKSVEFKEDVSVDNVEPIEEPVKPETFDYPDNIEDIKEQIYKRNIEYIEQIDQLDELVQTGDTDTREFWGDDWTSVDDWKKKSNGFGLKKNDDGSLIFTPDEQTARTYSFFENPLAYTYDEENKEFVNEVDFYGKTIYNVAKFINDDVLVMMTISGRKVDLNIYQKHAVPE